MRHDAEIELPNFASSSKKGIYVKSYSSVGPVILDLAGLELTPEDKEILLHPHVGGVIFFSRNYQEPEQLIQLIKQIRELRSNLLLCVDQEGGRVQRFKEGLTRLPPLRLLGKCLENSPRQLNVVTHIAEKLGFLMALEVRSLGVDLSFAPVLDLDRGISEVIGDRAFHSQPQMVTTLARAYIKGMNQAGMQAVGKHFPGHGGVAPDSHFTLPEDTRSFTALEEDYLPFVELSAKQLAGIMPAHIVYPAVDELPVGFSVRWLQNILRQQFKFSGAIVSDDLSMEGAKFIGDYPQRAQLALRAGCDYVLVCNNRQGAIEVVETIKDNADETAIQRRQRLFPTCPSSSFKELKTSKGWQEAYSGVEALHDQLEGSSSFN